MGAFNQTIDPAGGVNNAGITKIGNLTVYAGTGVFTTTGTTCVINTPFRTVDRILAAIVSPLCASGSEDQQDQPLYFTTVAVGTTTANVLQRDTTQGVLKPNTTGKATIARLASGSSGLGFSVIIIGYCA